jgi:hypothetical protein
MAYRPKSRQQVPKQQPAAKKRSRKTTESVSPQAARSETSASGPAITFSPERIGALLGSESPKQLANPAKVALVLQMQRTRGNRSVSQMVANVRGKAATSGARSAGMGQTQAPRRSEDGGRARGAGLLEKGVAFAQQKLAAAAESVSEKLATIPEVSLPKPRSPGSEIVANALREAARKGKQALASAAAATIRATTNTTEQQVHAVSVAESRSVDQIQAHAQTSRQQISESLAEHSHAVSTAHNSEQQKLQAWHSQANARTQEEVGKRQEAVTTAGAEHGAQLQQAGAQAAQNASGKLSSASAQAHGLSSGGGGDQRSSGRAQVASRLGTDAGSQFDSAVTKNEEQLHSHADEAAGALSKHASEAASDIGGITSVVEEQVGEALTAAAGEISDAGARSISSLQAGAEHAHAQLNTVESHATGVAAKVAAKHREQLFSAGAEATSRVRQQAETAAVTAQQQLDEHASHITGVRVDEKTAGEIAGQLQSQIAKAYTTTGQQIHELNGQISPHLNTAAQEGTQSLSRLQAQAAAGLASGNRSVTAEMARARRGAEASIHHGTSATLAGAEDGLSKTVSHLDQIVSKAKSGFAEAGASVGRSLETAVSDLDRQTSGALTGLHGRVAEGQARVDGFLARQGPMVQRSILGDIGDWFAGQFRDLWDMLSSPSFWVGLVVTIVLFPVMGPAALIVGGAVGGAVGGIEQNIKEGKKWYDWHNIVRNAAIGAGAGLVMALGVVAIAYFGLEGLAALAAVMVLSAVVGIVVNLINGQRWDKGLLANLLLAWLFRRLGGERVPEETPPEQASSAKPSGGRTTTRVPGLYENINPNQSPPGWKFQDVVSDLGGEKVVDTKVTAPEGSTGSMSRGLNPSTGEFVLHEAFLDGIPEDVRWVKTDPPMVAGRGTPLESYMTMRQMRILEGQTGRSLAISSPRVVRMSTIVNTRTIGELAQQVRAGAKPDEAIANTHSVRYASNSITQSGGKVASAHIEGGMTRPASAVLTPELTAKYGLQPSDPVLYAFDIVIDVVPADAPTGGNTGPLPVPAQQSDRDKQEQKQ